MSLSNKSGTRSSIDEESILQVSSPDFGRCALCKTSSGLIHIIRYPQVASMILEQVLLHVDDPRSDVADVRPDIYLFLLNFFSHASLQLMLF